jgi:hypothetical protein
MSKYLRSELEQRFEALLDSSARWLASEGVVVHYEAVGGGSKLSTLLGHDSKRSRFTDEDVARIKAVLLTWVDDQTS